MTSPLITKQQPSSVESPKIKDVEQKIVKNETQVKHSVEFLNGIKSNSTIKWIVEKIVAKIDEFQLSDEIDIDTNTVKVKIKIESDEQDNIYNIKFIDVQTKQVKSNNVQQNQESNVLNTIKNVRLCVHKKNVNGKTEYKFAVKLSKGAEEFIISENNEKLPYKSQVSALGSVDIYFNQRYIEAIWTKDKKEIANLS
ncbi:hypothetical protein IC220_04840 [Wolbachia endosymbiont of Pentalonia nigronervosa]|jgi:hypothetical protein|uniref:hypothetical protein n=1 Tax=Wolbachia endosymbiont of Pentalonia nigronervosa TaxID=1301914 RepID=UPI00165EF403|nr:hypothetical protein [Wolbachia endosymbiont of Pentalonia nigronervosa]MBD0391764.1 hypothetical protein [Wolbachia endosymbiont of Pentalonia nigronervosa]